MEALMKLKTQKTQEEFKGDNDATFNSFNYFCLFCLRSTLQDNKGNFSQCQECGMYGSNYAMQCSDCDISEEQYMYWRQDFESGKASSPETAVCAKCTGITLWSGEAPTITSNCKLCLKETPMKDYGVLQECLECRSICLPQSYLKTVLCQSCPANALREQAAADVSRDNKFFFIR